MREYKGIDIGRVFFACLIPLLHIGIPGAVPDVVKQFIARLGVPFFFAAAGMFLSRSAEKNGGAAALKKYALKIGRMLLIWLLIYLPILLLRQEGVKLQELLFKTPAYLWYLTALLAAAVPFCLVRNRKALLWVSLALYAFGTLFGETYRWLIGGFPAYEAIFLTTRNGIFFGLPMMCVGEASWKQKKTSWAGLGIAGAVCMAEIAVVGIFAAPTDDRSMYFALPGLIYFGVSALRNWNPKVDTTYLGGISSAIYVMQFGVITVVMKAAGLAGITGGWVGWLAWGLVLAVPTAFYLLLRKKRIVRILF